MKILNYDDDLLPKEEAALETYLKDKSKYGSLAFRDKEDPLASWAYPFVTGHKYKAHWGVVGIDFTDFQLEMSERWRNTDKPIYMVHNFTNQRHALNVFNGNNQVANNTLPKTWDPSGKTVYDVGVNLVINGTMKDPTAGLVTETPKEGESTTTPAVKKASEQGSKFLKYIISPKERSDKNLWKRQNLKFKGIFCIYHCNVEVDNNVDIPMVDYKWSEAATWKSTTAGRSPIAGEDLIVPAGWNLILDIAETPLLKKITVFGGITFSTELPSVHLKAYIISVRGGLI